MFIGIQFFTFFAFMAAAVLENWRGSGATALLFGVGAVIAAGAFTYALNAAEGKPGFQVPFGVGLFVIAVETLLVCTTIYIFAL